MDNNITSFEIRSSSTTEILCEQLKKRREETSSLNKCTALWFREKLFRNCCGTEGMGMRNRDEYKAQCKGKAVLYTSNALAGLVTIVLTIGTVGIYGIAAYKTYKADQAKVKPMTDVVPR